jgi:MoxR-like ATPase
LSNEFVKVIWFGEQGQELQNLIVAAKAHAAFNGKFSPDIEDVKLLQPEFCVIELLKLQSRCWGNNEEMIIAKLF